MIANPVTLTMCEHKTTQPAQSVSPAQRTAATQLLQAHFAIASGESSQAREALQHALALCKHEDDSCLQLLNPDIIRDLLHWSYKQGIEMEFVHQRIHAMQGASVTAVPAAAETVPIRIYCLGRFNVQINNEVVVQSSYGRNKPLELLKVLIALGGRQVSQEHISEILWPEALGDGAQRNFNTTLHRLRKLLGYSQAIVLKDTLLTLDSHYVQVDLWEAERLLGQLEQQLRHVHADEAQLQSLSERLFALFHGDFLATEPDRNWALLIKERLRNRMLKILQSLGKYWQAHQQSDLAREIFERGLALDPLHEVFYQHLMQLHINRGHHSHAAAIYERCRKMLATNLGVMPSGRTLSLYRQTQPA